MTQQTNLRNGGTPEQLMNNFIANEFDMVMVFNLPLNGAYHLSRIAQQHGVTAVATVFPESICYFPTPQQACRFTNALHGKIMDQRTIRAEGHRIGSLEDFYSFMEHFKIRKNVPMFKLR